MAVGADLPTLRELHGTFSRNSESADTIKKEVDTGVANAVWTGRYAEDFRNAWDEYRTNLDTLRDALTGAADDVRTNHNNIAAATGEDPM